MLFKIFNRARTTNLVQVHYQCPPSVPIHIQIYMKTTISKTSQLRLIYALNLNPYSAILYPANNPVKQSLFPFHKIHHKYPTEVSKTISSHPLISSSVRINKKNIKRVRDPCKTQKRGDYMSREENFFLSSESRALFSWSRTRALLLSLSFSSIIDLFSKYSFKFCSSISTPLLIDSPHDKQERLQSQFHCMIREINPQKNIYIKQG